MIDASKTGGTSPPEQLLTVPELAKWLRVSPAWVYDHTTRKSPRLPCVRLGELTRFRRAEIEAFLKTYASN